jgi:hypothetical protein
MTRIIGYPYSSVILIAFLGMSSSCELQSDEELREDIIGTWKREACDFPYNMEDNGVTEASPLRTNMTFYADGRIIENGDNTFCTEDSCDTVDISGYCTCTWTIEQGKLTIITLGNTGLNWLNSEFPINRLDDDALVFDNVTNNGVLRKKACYSRQ